MIQGLVVVFVLALSILSAKADPLFDCNKRKICDSLWTAAEGAGDGQRYFRRERP
jgi:hypothetical protein